jgi:uncharacterized membrane protein
MKPSAAYTILLVGSFLWCALVLLPPLFATASAFFPQLSSELYKAFSTICHQDDARSFHLLGNKLAVCIRCSSIYGSFFVGVLLVPVFPKRNWFLKFSPAFYLALMPMALDVLLDFIGMHVSNDWTRFLTGSLFGFISAIVLTPSLIEAFTQLFSSHTIQGVSHESQTQ